MKFLQTLLVAALLAFLAACSSLGVPNANTLNERLAVTTSTVTAVRNSAATLLQAKKLSVSDAENIQAQADNVIAGVTIARTIAVTDPAAADAKLRQTIAVLTALQSYLIAKEQTK